jgi:ferrous iron transport protein B
VCETGLPVVLCLNMIDEAASRGLDDRRGAAVRPPRGGRRRDGGDPSRGTGRSGLAAIERAPARGGPRRVPDPVERALDVIVPLMPAGAPLSPRALAVAVLAGDQTLTPWLRANLSDETLGRVEEVRQRLRRIYRDDLGYVIQQARRREAGELSREVVARARGTRGASKRSGARKLEVLTTHPLWGWPFLALVLYLAYLFVGVFGAKTLVDLLENGLFGKILSPRRRGSRTPSSHGRWSATSSSARTGWSRWRSRTRSRSCSRSSGPSSSPSGCSRTPATCRGSP